jgi:hypothetical protein
VAIIGFASAEVQDVFWSLGYLLRWVCSKELFVEEIPRMRVIYSSRGGMQVGKGLPSIIF